MSRLVTTFSNLFSVEKIFHTSPFTTLGSIKLFITCLQSTSTRLVAFSLKPHKRRHFPTLKQFHNGRTDRLRALDPITVSKLQKARRHADIYKNLARKIRRISGSKF